MKQGARALLHGYSVLQGCKIFCDTPRIDAKIASAVARLRTHVNPCSRAVRDDPEHDVVLEAVPLGGIERLDAALGRVLAGAGWCCLVPAAAGLSG